jgi:hypothetical protein
VAVDDSGYHLISLDESDPVRKKKKGSGIAFLDNWKKEFRNKRKKRAKTGSAPDELEVPNSTRRRSLPHDNEGENAPRSPSPALQIACHSDSAMQNRSEIKRAQSSTSKARITKSCSTVNLNVVTKNDL